MNAQPILGFLAKLFTRHNLEVIMIGNSAAALQGAPVTTMDIDFMFRDSPVNLRKLKLIAKDLGATIFRPYYPVSRLYRLEGGPYNVQVDFMPVIHGIKSFASLRHKAQVIEVLEHKMLIADLSDIITSKKSANRPQDKAVLPILKKTYDEKKKIEKEKK